MFYCSTQAPKSFTLINNLGLQTQDAFNELLGIKHKSLQLTEDDKKTIQEELIKTRSKYECLSDQELKECLYQEIEQLQIDKLQDQKSDQLFSRQLMNMSAISEFMAERMEAKYVEAQLKVKAFKRNQAKKFGLEKQTIKKRLETLDYKIEKLQEIVVEKTEEKKDEGSQKTQKKVISKSETEEADTRKKELPRLRPRRQCSQLKEI